jgi:hypothetical protein
VAAAAELPGALAEALAIPDRPALVCVRSSAQAV